MSVLRRNYISIDPNARFREELTQSPELFVGLRTTPAASVELRGRLGGDGTAIPDGNRGSERRLPAKLSVSEDRKRSSEREKRAGRCQEGHVGRYRERAHRRRSKRMHRIGS